MIKTNWHTHTQRCGHAKGSEEEYVLSAIKAGIKTLGFSDHAAFPIEGPGMRMNQEEFPEYMAEVKRLKEKYKDDIDIYLGVECEYFPDYIETIEQYRRDLDYLILGQHGLSIYRQDSYYMNDPKELIAYVELIEKACELGLCDYIAHPDLCLWSYPKIDETAIEVANRIADVALKYNIPIEANCGAGVHVKKNKYLDGERYPYPSKAFFEIFAKKGCEVVIGLDIHDPKEFNTDKYINRALEIVNETGCKITYDYDLVKYAKLRRKEYKFID